MKKSSFFYTSHYRQIQQNIKKMLNEQPEFLSSRSLTSPRATGDAIQDVLAENFKSLLGDSCKEYSSQFARRAMADLAFKDVNDFYYIVDVKTHRQETGFHMPNLTSVERLARFYEDDMNYFTILFISYSVEDNGIAIDNVHFIPIEFLSWKCLTIGALNWGQIQIANAEKLDIVETSRKSWMLEFCDRVLTFYPREISKINDRISHFENVKTFWQKKEE